MSVPDPPQQTTPSFRLRGAAGGLVIIRMTVTSRMVASAVVRPQLDAWVLPDGSLAEAKFQVAPRTVYLAGNQEARLTLTATVPTGLAPGSRVRGGLYFPGIEEDHLGLELEIAPAEAAEPAHEHQISVMLPLTGYDPAPDSQPLSNKTIYKLVGGLAGLEVIPAKWIVAELLFTVCEIGADYGETEEGAALLDRLSRLRFFKNGVLAFRGSHLPNWIMIGMSVSSGLQSAVGGRESQGRMLYTWEKWLLDLIDIDLEFAEEEGPEVLLPPPELDRSLARLGTTAEKWFGCLLLGLHRLSPRLRGVFEQLAAGAPEAIGGGESDEPDEAADVLSEDGSIQR